jgi:hypothetical protein
MKFQVRVISGKTKRPLPGSLHTVVRIQVQNHFPKSPNSRDVLFLKKEAPARKPAHSSPNFCQKPILSKVEFGSNDLSGFEATCILTPPANPKST